MLSSAPVLDQGFILPAGLTSKPQHAEIEILPDSYRVSLRVADKDINAIESLLKIDLPRKVCSSLINNQQSILCISPDEWLLIDELSQRDYIATVLKKAAEKFAFSYVDISHRNVALRINGIHAIKLLNVGCPLDLSLSEFPIGKCTRTIYENAEIVILREAENTFHVEMWRSFAPYICGFFSRYMTSLY